MIYLAPPFRRPLLSWAPFRSLARLAGTRWPNRLLCCMLVYS